MDNEMIERVVAAMQVASYVEGLSFEQERRHIARAAIEAMRRPTRDMLVAAAAELERQHVALAEESSAIFPGQVFSAMIDAALGANQ